MSHRENSCVIVTSVSSGTISLSVSRARAYETSDSFADTFLKIVALLVLVVSSVLLHRPSGIQAGRKIFLNSKSVKRRMRAQTAVVASSTKRTLSTFDRLSLISLSCRTRRQSITSLLRANVTAYFFQPFTYHTRLFDLSWNIDSNINRTGFLPNCVVTRSIEINFREDRREKQREGETCSRVCGLNIPLLDFPFLPMDASSNRQDKYLCLFSPSPSLFLPLPRFSFLLFSYCSGTRTYACTPPHVPSITAATLRIVLG